MVERTVNSGRPAQPEEVAEAILWLGLHAPLYLHELVKRYPMVSFHQESQR